MPQKIFDHVGRSGLRSTLLLDPDGRPVLRHRQDCADILEENRQAQANYDPAPERRGGAWRRVASIPFVVWMELERRGIVQGAQVVDERAFLRFLSDPETRHLRTDNGKRLA